MKHQNRIAGLSGVAFAAIVLILNVVENAVTARPEFGADAEEVAAWAADAGAHLWVATALVPLAWFLLPVFVAGLLDRLAATGGARFPAILAIAGAAMTMGTLSTAIAADAVLVAHADALTLDAVRVLSSLSTTLFVFNWAALALALYGISRVASELGLLPRWLDRASLVGSGLLLLGSLGAAAVLDGVLATMLLGIVGFVTWLLVLVVGGVRLARASAPVADHAAALLRQPPAAAPASSPAS